MSPTAKDFDSEAAVALSAIFTDKGGGEEGEDEDEDEGKGSATISPRRRPESMSGRTMLPLFGRTISSSSRMDEQALSKERVMTSLLQLVARGVRGWPNLLLEEEEEEEEVGPGRASSSPSSSPVPSIEAQEPSMAMTSGDDGS